MSIFKDIGVEQAPNSTLVSRVLTSVAAAMVVLFVAFSAVGLG